MMKIKKEKNRRAVELMILSEVRKKNISEYFLWFTKFHRPWLHKLASAFKELKQFPMNPIALLPHFYEHDFDKEVAAFGGLLLSPDCDYEQIQEFNDIFHNHPWDWFRYRGFVELSLGDTMENTTAGVKNWRIAHFFDVLYDLCYQPLPYDGKSIVIKAAHVVPLGVIFDKIRIDYELPALQVLREMTEKCGINNPDIGLRYLLQVLGSNDGIGIHEWDIPAEQLKCPLVPGLREFVATWFPEYRVLGSIDEAISLFGFEKDCDLLYAFYGYQELQRKSPDACSRYAKTYNRWYELGCKKKPYLWRETLPALTI